MRRRHTGEDGEVTIHRVFENSWERVRGCASGNRRGGAGVKMRSQTQGRLDPKDSEGQVVRTGFTNRNRGSNRREKTHIYTYALHLLMSVVGRKV